MSSTTNTVVIPRIPQELIDRILDHVAGFDLPSRFLRSCALVSKSWLLSCRRYLFRSVKFTRDDMDRWLKVFPVPEESPAHHVRHLHLWVGSRDIFPDAFRDHIPWFTGVKMVNLSARGSGRSLQTLSVWRLSHSVTSLTASTGEVTPERIRDAMVLLPNLDNLSLSGSLHPAARKELIGMGKNLKGRFRGRLRLLKGLAHSDVVNMLLEVPTGLHFTGVEVRGTYECLLPTVRLVEACGGSLVKFAYTVSLSLGFEAFERSFNFSKLPNLREVEFAVGWTGGGLLWIPVALSTINIATSPNLSTIKLDFACPTTHNRSVDALIEGAGDDLRRVADEVSRIEQEFGGAVNLTVLRDPWFWVALDALNILQHLDY